MAELGAALELGALGWSIVPVHGVVGDRCDCGNPDCPSLGKHPHVSWTDALTEAARPDEIEDWWQRWPDANVGVVTGWVSAIVVVDVDPRHGGNETLAVLEADHEPLPETVASATGGGGRHLYFAHPPHLVPTRPLAAGVDLRGEGGIVVAPPSRHASGLHYEWLQNHGPTERLLSPLPPWLDRLAVRPRPTLGSQAPAEIARTPTERQEFADVWESAGIELSGGEVMVLCPFHDDHHPSLHIDADGCRWFCFGCRRGGGVQAVRRLTGDAMSARRELGGTHAPPNLDGDELVHAVGESRYQDALLALTGGKRTWAGAHSRVVAQLVPEFDNPNDPNAVEVRIGGELVGYLPREMTARYHHLIAETIATEGAARCEAEIRGGWERPGGDIGRFGVIVLLPHVPGDRP